MSRLIVTFFCLCLIVSCQSLGKSEVKKTVGLEIVSIEGHLVRSYQNPQWSYYLYNGKRKMIPPVLFDEKYHNAVMESYGWKETDIIPMSDQALDRIPVVGDMTIKPGTFLIRGEGAPQVYEITSTGLKLIPDQEIKPSDKIVTCPDVFFWHYFILN